MCRSVHVSGVESGDQSDAAADCGFPQLMFGDYPSSEADNFTISTLSHQQHHPKHQKQQQAYSQCADAWTFKLVSLP